MRKMHITNWFEYWRKAKGYCIKMGYYKYAEDFASYTVEKVLEGKSVWLNTLLIDFLRMKTQTLIPRSIRPNTLKGHEGEWQEVNIEFTGVSFHEAAQPHYHEVQRIIEIFNEVKHGDILKLYFVTGLQMTEIGEQLGITESRVSQIIRVGLNSVRERLKIDELVDKRLQDSVRGDHEHERVPSKNDSRHH